MKKEHVKISIIKYDNLIEAEKRLELFKKSTTVYLRYTGPTHKVFTDDEAVSELIKMIGRLNDEICRLKLVKQKLPLWKTILLKFKRN